MMKTASDDVPSSPLAPRPARSGVDRLAVLVAVVLGGLSISFMLPDRPPMRECAIAMDLPEQLESWKGFDREPSPEEIDKLAADTRFEKKDYFIAHPVWDTPVIHEWHRVSASIVLSGQDLNSSIHRPERCLPAQGFKDLRSEIITLDVGDRPLKLARLRCYTEPIDRQSGRHLATPDGHRLRLQHVIYYWFVGSHSTTASHYERTWIDMKDRLLGGFDQHWAYVLLSASFTDDLVAKGLPRHDSFYPEGRTEAETDRLLTELARIVCKHSVRWDKID